MTDIRQLLYAIHEHAVVDLDLLKKLRGSLPSEPSREQLKDWLGLANDAATSAAEVARNAYKQVENLEKYLRYPPEVANANLEEMTRLAHTRGDEIAVQAMATLRRDYPKIASAVAAVGDFMPEPGDLFRDPEVIEAKFEEAKRLASESGDENAREGLALLRREYSKIRSILTASTEHIASVLEEIGPVYDRHKAVLPYLSEGRLLTGTLAELRVWVSRIKPETGLAIAVGLLAASAAVGAVGGSSEAKAEPGHEPARTARPQAADAAKTTTVEAMLADRAKLGRMKSELPNQKGVTV